MDDVSAIGHQKHRKQTAQDLRSILRHHWADQAGHADGRQADDDVHDLDEHLIEAVDDLRRGKSLLPGQQHAETQEQGDHDDLEHCGAD